jgi:hypothetical protein
LLGSFRLIQLEVDVASLPWKERKAREDLLFSVAVNDVHFLDAAVLFAVILYLSGDLPLVPFDCNFRLVEGERRLDRKSVV